MKRESKENVRTVAFFKANRRGEKTQVHKCCESLPPRMQGLLPGHMTVM